LHQFVSQIGNSPLFATAQIKSLEVLPADKQPAQTNFTLRVVVRPGYAVQGGSTSGQSPPTAVTSDGPPGATPRLARGGIER
jgi:hypothetical protein